MEIPEQLTLLAELSRVEAKIRGHQNRLEAIPAAANQAKTEAVEKKSAFDIVDQQRLNIDKQRAEKERSLAEARDHLKKWRLRLEKIRDEREHAALLSEIGGQKHQIGRLENEILEFMETIEELEKDGASKKEIWDAAQEHADEEFSKVQGDLAEVNSNLNAEEGARDSLVGQLPDTLVKRYHKISARRKGMGIAMIKGEICSGCHTTLPPQICLMVHKGAVIEPCPGCSRILVHESMTRSSATESAAAEAAGA